MFISDVLRAKGRHVVTMRTTDTAAQAVTAMAANRIGAVVVRDSWGKPMGVFSERDVLNALAGDGAEILQKPLASLMSSPIVTCPSTLRIDAALALMTRERIRHLPVVDDGALIGIVSIGDLVKHRLDEKELEANVLLDRSRMRA